jgi:hypothetical protein
MTTPDTTPRTSYEVQHHGRPVSPRYASWTEAELFCQFSTPGTDDYRVVPVADAPDAPTGLTLHTDQP